MSVVVTGLPPASRIGVPPVVAASPVTEAVLSKCPRSTSACVIT